MPNSISTRVRVKSKSNTNQTDYKLAKIQELTLFVGNVNVHIVPHWHSFRFRDFSVCVYYWPKRQISKKLKLCYDLISVQISVLGDIVPKTLWKFRWVIWLFVLRIPTILPAMLCGVWVHFVPTYLLSNKPREGLNYHWKRRYSNRGIIKQSSS